TIFMFTNQSKQKHLANVKCRDPAINHTSLSNLRANGKQNSAAATSATRPYKIMLVGDGMVGKSAICKSYINKTPYLAYQPTISETHEITVSIHKKDYLVILWDTNAGEEWDGLRIQDYKNTDCFILCYAINDPTSLSNVETRWILELRKHCPNVPVLLVGTKTDIRTPSNRWISEEEGDILKTKVKAEGFIECSSKSIASIEGVFILAVSIAEKYRESETQSNSRRLCLIL
ncbi:Ras-like GTP-binding protein RhoL, partial [Orchesella cincta]